LRFLATLLLAAGAAGCAAPRPALFAVIPSEVDGHVGTIVVDAGGERRVIHSAYGAQRLKADGSVEAQQLDEKAVRAQFGTTLAAMPVPPATFTLYFLEGSDELTPESKAELDKVFTELKRRPLPDILVTGYTDTVGTMAYNDELSKARARHMRDLLVSLGIPKERIQTAGRGKREPLVATANNVPEPRNRRVEISVR
jgi:outer membrane protein OmpA-like peptidoglycan-associated protein